MMGKITKSILVTKPEQITKLDSGPIHIILGPNLRIKNNKKTLKKIKSRRSKWRNWNN